VPGLPQPLEVEMRIAEDRSTSVAAVVGRDPWLLEIDGGALEDTQQPRRFGREQALLTFTRLLLEIADRVDPRFEAPALDAPLSLASRAAWQAYDVGRAARLGVRAHQPRFRYNFRSRVGFSDAADAAFERLWSADGLTWADIERIVADVDAGGTSR